MPCVRRARPRSPLDLCVHRAERLGAGVRPSSHCVPHPKIRNQHRIETAGTCPCGFVRHDYVSSRARPEPLNRHLSLKHNTSRGRAVPAEWAPIMCSIGAAVGATRTRPFYAQRALGTRLNRRNLLSLIAVVELGREASLQRPCPYPRPKAAA